MNSSNDPKLSATKTQQSFDELDKMLREASLGTEAASHNEVTVDPPPEAPTAPAESPSTDSPEVLHDALPAHTQGDAFEQVELGQEASEQGEQQKQKLGFAKVAVAAGLIAAVAYWLLPSSLVSSATTSVAPTSSTAPTTQTSAPAETAAGPTGVSIDIGSGGIPGGEISRVAADAEKAAAVLPVEEQNCDTDRITGFDRAVCRIEGPQRFFQCTEGIGRKWNNELPGCSLVNQPANGGYHLGQLPGLEGTVLLNKLTSLALAGANDSVLAIGIHRAIAADISAMDVLATAEKFEHTPISTYAPLHEILLTKEEKNWDRASGQNFMNRNLPERFLCFPKIEVFTPKEVSTSPTPKYEISLEKCSRKNLFDKAPASADPKAYISLLREITAKIRHDVNKAKSFLYVIDLSVEDKGRNRATPPEYVPVREGYSVKVPFLKVNDHRGPISFFANESSTNKEGNLLVCDRNLSFGAFSNTLDSNLDMGAGWSGGGVLGGDQHYYPVGGMASATISDSDILNTCTSFNVANNFSRGIVIADHKQYESFKGQMSVGIMLSSPRLLDSIKSDVPVLHKSQLLQEVGFDIAGFHILDKSAYFNATYHKRPAGPVVLTQGKMIPADDSTSIIRSDKVR